MALELGVIGLMNTQFAIEGDDVYVLEVNPHALPAPCPMSRKPPGDRWPKSLPAAWWGAVWLRRAYPAR